MKYVASKQVPHIENNLVVGWTLGVTATEGTKSVTITEEVELPPEERLPVEEYTTQKLEQLLTRISNERDMPYRAATELKKLL